MQTDDLIIILKSIASQTQALARAIEDDQTNETLHDKRLRLLQRRDVLTARLDKQPIPENREIIETALTEIRQQIEALNREIFLKELN